MSSQQRQNAPATSAAKSAGGSSTDSQRPAASPMDELFSDLAGSSNASAVASLRDDQTTGMSPDDGPLVNENSDEVLDALGDTAGRKVVVLDASTSTTPVDKARYFKPDTLYSASLNIGFFKALANPDGPNLGELATELGPCNEDVIEMGGTRISGTEPRSVTFAIQASEEPTSKSWISDSVEIQAANNGMLNLARLSSAWISIAPSVGDAQKITIVGKLNLGTDPNAEDDEARRETAFTTTPPSFNPLANNTGNHLIAAMAGAMGFARDVDPSALTKPALQAEQPQNSSRAMGDMAEREIAAQWLDEPEDRTFVTTPPTGISDAVISAVSDLLGEKAAVMNKGTDDAPDYTPGSVRGVSFGTQKPYDFNFFGDKKELNQGIKSQVLDTAKAVGENVRLQILAAIPAGMASEVPETFQRFVPKMTAAWKEKVNAAFSQVNWDLWYARHFEPNIKDEAGPSAGSISTSHTGSGEGYVHNDERLRMEGVEP